MKFKKEVRDFVIPYYERNDGGHLIDHADSVCEMSLDINRTLNLHQNEKEIIVAAYMHDMFTTDRDQHHILAHDYIIVNAKHLSFLKDFSKEEVERIAKAVLQHRKSSGKQIWHSKLSEIIASADLGEFDLNSMMIRSYKYHTSKNGKNPDEAIAAVHEHLKDKFGTNGYTVYPDLYIKYMKKKGIDIVAIRKKIDRLNLEEVKSVIKNAGYL